MKYEPPTIEEFAESAERKGWWAHMVYDACDYPYHTNLHTHNLWEKFGQVDFQMCLRVPPELFAQIIDQLAHQVTAHGRRYEAGQVLDDVLAGYSVELVPAREGGRDVLRIVMPDKHGRFRDGNLAAQYEQTYLDEAH